MRITTLVLSGVLLAGAANARANLAFVEDFSDGELLADPTWEPDPSPECGPDPWVHWQVEDGRLHADGCPLDRPHRGALTTHDHACRITAGTWEFVGRLEQQGELQLFFAMGDGGASWAVWIADNPSPASFGWVNHRAICLKNTRSGWTDVICTPWVPATNQDYHVVVTRSADADWSLTVDDSLIGSAHDPDFPVDQQQVVIYQDKTPVQVDDIRFFDESGACGPPAVVALAQTEPSVFETEVDDGDAEEPEGASLRVLLELPADVSAEDIDLATVRLEDSEGPVAAAASTEPTGFRTWLSFSLDLAAASRLVGTEALEVEVESGDRVVRVRTASAPGESLDLRDLLVTGSLLTGAPFTAPCTIVVQAHD